MISTTDLAKYLVEHITRYADNVDQVDTELVDILLQNYLRDRGLKGYMLHASPALGNFEKRHDAVLKVLKNEDR